jgi:signal transduction histidine kinase/CheY-like chemotaxis protein
MGRWARQDRGGGPRWWVIALAVGAALTALDAVVLPRGGLLAGMVLTAGAALLVVAGYAGMRMNRQPPAVRRLTTVTWATQAVAAAWHALYPHLSGHPLPFPSPADALFLASDVLLLTLLVAVNRSSASRDRGATIDAVIVTCAIATVSWAFLVRPLLKLDGGTSEELATIAYAVVDLTVLGLLLRIWFLHGAGNVAQSMLGAGIIVFVVSNETYAANLLVDGLAEQRVYDTLFLLAWTLLAAGVLHPSLPLASAAGSGQHTLTRGRLAFLAAIVVLPVTVAMAEMVLIGDLGVPARTAIYVVGAVMSLLVLERMRGLLVDISKHRELQRLKNEFTSVVSHELRTPLTSIRGSLGLMAGGALGEMPPQAQRMLDIAVTNTDRLIRLINDILDLERVESGEVVMKTERIMAGEVVRQATRQLEGMASEAGVRLETDGDAVVRGDRDRLIQTITNLTGNAIKFSEAGGVVRVSVEQSGDIATFRVQDDGRGIPPDKLETIFEAFEQVDASDSREKGGTGLGLAISRRIVQGHGGRIWVESTVGEGSTFAFTIPAVAGEVPAGLADGPMVLLCDDDEAVLEVLAAMLTNRGYRVLTAASGDEAVRLAMRERPDAVLLDILMPGFDGWETLAALRDREETRDIPVVMASVLPSEGDRPVEGWVEKPVDEPSLFSALEDAIRGDAGHRRVLVVEDDDDLAQVLVERLAACGVAARHAGTVEEAIRLAREIEPDLLVLDLGLPDGDGSEVVEALRANGAERCMPVVVYTARDVSEADRGRLEIDDTAYLLKSRITLEEFETRVLDLLARVAPATTQ